MEILSTLDAIIDFCNKVSEISPHGTTKETWKALALATKELSNQFYAVLETGADLEIPLNKT